MKQHIKLPEAQELKELCDHEAPICITVTFPTEKAGADTLQNPVRLKNARQLLQKKLEKIGRTLDEYPALKKHLDNLYSDKELWQHQEKGFCLLWAPEFEVIFQTPYELPETVMIDKRFYLKDLLVNAERSYSYNVLLLNETQPRIKKGFLHNHDTRTLAPPKELESLEHFLRAHDFEKSLQFSSQSKERVGESQTPRYHGQGVAGDEKTMNKYRAEYMKHIENWTCDVMSRESADYNLLVGDERLCGLYLRSLRDTHPEIQVLSHQNTESIGDTDLRGALDKFLTQQDRSLQQQEMAEVSQLHNTQTTPVLYDLEDIVLAAHNQRIDKLIIANDLDEEFWGFITEDSSSQKVKRELEFNGVGSELLNLAAIDTYKNNGKIVPLDSLAAKQDLKQFNERQMAAICRW